MPSNIFFGTGIPASIIIIDKKERENRKGIFFIDAKDGYKKDGAKNRLREQDIKHIVDAWEAQETIPHYCRMVEWEEIEKNDYNLNIPRYIQPVDNEIQHDIEAHLHGGLPAFDIDKMDDYWNACPSLKDSLFNDRGDGYYELKINKEEIASTIENDSSYQAQGKAFNAMLMQWNEDVKPKMMDVNKGSRPKELIVDWAESLLSKAKGHCGLVNPYEVYDVLLNYWAETIQDDCYMVANDGWTYPEVKAVKRKETTDKKTNTTKVKESVCLYDEIVCDLLPVNILLREFFTKETDEIANLQSCIEIKQTAMDELVEQNADAFTFDDDDSEEEKVFSVKAADVKKAIKNAKNSGIPEADIKILKQWITLSDNKEKLSKTLKQKRSDLTDAIVKKYADLTENEVKELVVEHKWLDTIMNSCNALMQTVTYSIAGGTMGLVERYSETLSSLTDDVIVIENEVNACLREMGFDL